MIAALLHALNMASAMAWEIFWSACILPVQAPTRWDLAPSVLGAAAETFQEALNLRRAAARRHLLKPE
jgi:hypothetical protein